LKRQPLFFAVCIVLIVALLLVWLRRQPLPEIAQTVEPTPTTLPSTQPTDEKPATQPSLATSTTMLIDRQRVDFPAARLRVGSSDGRVIAVLHSDDPRDAINDRYAGNSFYFQMELDVPEVRDFSDTDWKHQASTDEEVESPYGIFVDGHRTHLQPRDVRIKFESTGPDLTMITISGEFLLVDVQNAAAATRVVPVLAEFMARTVVKP
jgi:hypothetical protein